MRRGIVVVAWACARMRFTINVIQKEFLNLAEYTHTRCEIKQPQGSARQLGMYSVRMRAASQVRGGPQVHIGTPPVNTRGEPDDKTENLTPAKWSTVGVSGLRSNLFYVNRKQSNPQHRAQSRNPGSSHTGRSVRTQICVPRQPTPLSPRSSSMDHPSRPSERQMGHR